MQPIEMDIWPRQEFFESARIMKVYYYFKLYVDDTGHGEIPAEHPDDLVDLIAEDLSMNSVDVYCAIDDLYSANIIKLPREFRVQSYSVAGADGTVTLEHWADEDDPEGQKRMPMFC